MKKGNILELVANALQGVCQNPEETLQKIQNEGGEIIKPCQELSRKDRMVGELTPALLLLHHYWKDSGNKAEFIKAQAVSENSKGGNADNLTVEYVKMRTCEKLARSGFWAVVDEEFNTWNIDNLVVGQVAGQPVIVERNPNKEHKGVSVTIGDVTIGVGGLLAILVDSLTSGCSNQNCPITCHPRDREEETEN